ncbi:MAG: hypothetical protein K2X77_09310 [Candidatus Obscuribacterales bacterium]|jgi:hypothetical protein|nr:hypothetical protein [Candidatus Obscuribacterales bacterium]
MNTAKDQKKLHLVLAGLFVLPIIELIYRFAFPMAPFLIIDFGNQLNNTLVGMYFLFPSICLITAFFSRQHGLARCWAVVALPCVLAAFLWTYWTWQITDDYVNPDVRLKSTLFKEGSYSIKHYETVTGAYLTEERVILPGIKIGRDLQCLENGLSITMLPQNNARCVSATGKSIILELKRN